MIRKRFAFRLQRVLRQREIVLRQQRAELVRVQRQLTIEQRKLSEAQQRRAAIVARMTPKAGELLDLEELQRGELWIEQIDAEIASQEQTVTAAYQAVVAQEGVVAKAGQDVKVLEKLRDQKREEHRIEQLRVEQVFLDDVAGQQFLLRRPSSDERPKETSRS